MWYALILPIIREGVYETIAPKQIPIWITLLLFLMLIITADQILQGGKSIKVLLLVIIFNAIVLSYVDTNLIYLFILFEMFNFTLFILILSEYTIKYIFVTYIILGNIATVLFIAAISLFYCQYATIELLPPFISHLNIIPLLLLFKLGLFPFSFWVAPLYQAVSFRIFWILSLVPKLWYLVFLTKFLGTFTYLGTLTLLPSLLFASVAPVAGNGNIKSLLAYSSIINIAFAFFLASII